ncbi:hypothetical protein LAZ67_18000538 [Cordylochernes scorpioides]|uniref:B box-type domain-containing protein n=1 Tax=Cordylochernes scorpioides TaxID=51811 RepID=A0ABY6LHJ5_9ARAC|nr:hypothetical protein LAZ67_18000538 [Cordylochernes scorpioides]
MPERKKKDRKTIQHCQYCFAFLCKEHSVIICQECHKGRNKTKEASLDHLLECMGASSQDLCSNLIKIANMGGEKSDHTSLRSPLDPWNIRLNSDRDAWRHLRLFIGHDNNNNTTCIQDRDAWRHLRLFIGHDNNNNTTCIQDRDAWRHLRLFIGHDNNKNNTTCIQDRGQCCDRDAWRHLRLFIGHDNNKNNTTCIQDRGQCCDRDAWRHLRLFIGHDNNNNNRLIFIMN